MFPLTPPHSNRKANPQRRDTFMGKRNRLAYYEDLYSKRKPEEFREGRAQICETDSDSDSEEDVDRGVKTIDGKDGSAMKMKGAPGFLKRFATPKEKSLVVGGPNGQVRSRSGIFTYLAQEPARFPIHRQEAVGGFRPTKNATPSLTNTPAKTSLPPQSYGMFAASAAKLDPPPTNSAKEAMDDVLGPTNTSFDKESFTLAADGTTPAMNDDMVLPPTTEKSGKILDKAGDVIDPALNDAAQEGFEGDVEDNEVDLADARDARDATRAMKSRRRFAEPEEEAERQSPAKQRGKTRQVESPVRFSARLKKGLRERGSKTSSRTIGSKLEMRETRPGKSTKRMVRGSKRSLRLRNWKGESIDGDDTAIVVVYDDEGEDVSEFVRILE